MTTIRLSTIGWSIDQWNSLQCSLQPEDALQNIIDLVSTFDSTDPAWITIASKELLKSQWEALPTDGKTLPLYGVPFAVKDNIDVEGFPTTAACPGFYYVAEKDAQLVTLLKQAGAIVVGKTNLDQFATGLVGTRSPYGKPTCTFSKDHVSGGSSSGSASVVSRGLCPFALGTDTAGSGRVPAALNNIVGLKPTVGAFSGAGLVPACKSLDCISLFALNLRDAQKVFSIGAKYDPNYGYSRKLPQRPLTTFGKRPVFAVPQEPEFFGDNQNAKVYQDSLKRFQDLGVELVKVDFTLLYELAQILYEGPWVAERYAAIREFMVNRPSELDPVVHTVVKKAENFTAADFFDYEYRRQDILKRIERDFASYDGLIVPTCPLNPTYEDIEKEPILVNSRQGTYTNFVNLGDMSGLAIPAGFREDGLPQGITLLSGKFKDYALLEMAQRFLSVVPNRTVGSTKVKVQGCDMLHPTIPDTEPQFVQLAVVGGHLSGMALNWQLQKVNATLAKKTVTSDCYRLYVLPNSVPRKPGLRRVAHHGEQIVVEIWNVPTENFGAFISMVPHPLGIGNVELVDGSWVKGFICEEAGYIDVVNSNDITMYGGWRSFVSDTSKAKPFHTVLVANRGEIAVRIIKTLKRLGIKAVAVFSEPDRYAQHVRDADDCVPLNGSTAAETYLSVRKIINAAKITGCQAIIPGYGFLSENADFAQVCEDEGIVFVGPSADAIRKLGLKHSAREIAKAAGVPLVPGSPLLETVEEAVTFAQKIEYPLMIKSTAGGGGIGLQRVSNEQELRNAFENVKRQGQAFFNDSGVFLERFVDNARHVEVQVFGDGKGDGICLGERDCSLQRRNQKIIEETPAPNFPDATRQRMKTAAVNLVKTLKYKNAGTVEFIYDEAKDEFYFLEVNARLQVEHPITESVTGLDLVEWMLYIAADRAPDFGQEIVPQGASMEARLYAENPAKGFLPCPGQITNLTFPDDIARVDTWVSKGTKVSAEYDPTLAKIIVKGKDRDEALQKLINALDMTQVSGVVTNIDYLRSIAASENFTNANVSTKVLDSYKYAAHAIEITVPGSYTTVQDYPGRTQLWHVGVPPSGPMDSYAFRIANRIVGNHSKAPAIECTLNGPSLVFHHDAIVAVTGGECPATLDGQPVALWKPFQATAGQKLVIGKLTSGCRCYIAIRGGIDVPEYLGSRSTFALGNLGGYNGRTLKIGDILFLGRANREFCSIPMPVSEPQEAPSDIIPASYGNTWHVGVTCGPHGAPDFFTEQSLRDFFAAEWRVHYNSNRFGVRLCGGPKPEWARKDGGEAGLHPSNAHDYPYSIGAINFTGDEPVILTCDGPSLGGFVCCAVVIESEMWKIGQAKPGDKLKFIPVSYTDAIAMKEEQTRRIENFSGSISDRPTSSLTANETPILYQHNQQDKFMPKKIVYRQAGDRYILVEYGDNVLDLNLAYRIHKLTQEATAAIGGIVEITPGVRSALIEFDNTKISQSDLMGRLIELEKSIRYVTRWQVPSRIIKLPLTFEDKKTTAAVDRYCETIKADAPWLPSNVDFLAKINGFQDRNEVRDVLYQARYLVLGRGDVFLGAPCAVPLDPRHRLVGSKYNPSRTYTPNGAVGIGGMYMCIYAMDSPGGYQLVGRTIPIWDKLMLSNSQPWLLSQFDQIEFYPVSEKELDRRCQEVVNGRYAVDVEESVFDFGAYQEWLEKNKESIASFSSQKLQGHEEMVRLLDASATSTEATNSSDDSTPSTDTEMTDGDTNYKLYAEVVAGRFWKSCVNPGDKVTEGQGVVILEAMKTEMVVNSPISGTIVSISHSRGDMIEPGDLIAIIEPDE